MQLEHATPIKNLEAILEQGLGIMYWEGPRMPGDSRSEQVTCSWDWFWGVR